MQWPGNQPGMYQQEFGGGPAPQYYSTSGNVGGGYRSDPRVGPTPPPPQTQQQQWPTAPPAREGYSIRRVEMRRSDSGLPWGFRVRGGADVGAPFVIESIEPHGLAHRAGLRIGDRVLFINGSSTSSMRHEDLKMEIIRGGDALEMHVERLADATEGSLAPLTAAPALQAAHYSQSPQLPSSFPPQNQPQPPPSHYPTQNPTQYAIQPNQPLQPQYPAMAPPQPIAAGVPTIVYQQMPPSQSGYYATPPAQFPRQQQYYPATQPQAQQLAPQYDLPPQSYYGQQPAYQWQQQQKQQQSQQPPSQRHHDDSYCPPQADRFVWSTPQMPQRSQMQQLGVPHLVPTHQHTQQMPQHQQLGVSEGWPQQTDAGESIGGSPYARPQSKVMADSLITYESSPASDRSQWAPDFGRRPEPQEGKLRGGPPPQRLVSPMHPTPQRPAAPMPSPPQMAPPVQMRPMTPTPQPPPPTQQPSGPAGRGAPGPGTRRQRRADRGVPAGGPEGSVPVTSPATANEGMWMTSGPPVPQPGTNLTQVAPMAALPAEPALEFQAPDGRVRRVVQPSYNTPIGLYSSDNVHDALVKTMSNANVNVPISQVSPQAKPAPPVQQREPAGQLVAPIWPPPARPVRSFTPLPIAVRQPPPPLRPPQPLMMRPRVPPSGLQRTQSHDSVVRCAVCSFGIRGVFVRAGPAQSPVHAECFKCARCDTSLRGRSYCFLEGSIYCDAHAKQVRRDAPIMRADEGPIRSF